MQHIADPRRARRARRSSSRRAALLALLAIVATGCASGDAGSDASAVTPSTATADDGTAAPSEDHATGEATAADGPERIVSLSPTATEVLFAIGAGDQVVAVDDQSDFPPEAPVTDLSGFTPNVEAIAAYEPDLVVASGDPGDLASSLEALDIELLLQDAATTLEQAYEQIAALGEATGHPDEAATLVEDMQADIEAILAEAPDFDEPPTYYHELDPSLFSITSATFIGDVYDEFGLVNIADQADADTPYPQLSAEFVIEANPDVVFLADGQCCDQTAETVGARDGWSTVTAVEDGAIFPVDEDIASRWGPRVVDFMQAVADDLATLAG